MNPVNVAAANRISAALFANAFVAIMMAWPALARGEVRESFDMAVPTSPGPVTIDGREWLVYELHLTNFSREPLRLVKVDVLDANDIAQSFEGVDLAQRTTLAASSRPDVQPVRPGERAIVYLEVHAYATRPPRMLRHRVSYERGSQGMAEVVGGHLTPVAVETAALGPPLRGGPWAAVYAWEWPRGHRRVHYTVDGRARLPGRFAIDWVRKDTQGNPARGDADIVKNALGYGAEVLAVADARVAAVRQGVPEPQRVSANSKHSLDEAAGNYIALDIGGGRFAIYEHLKPASVRVKTGDRVRRGQVLASLGFTGDSTEPHLHFHVADAASPLAGEGLPYEFERFGVQASGGTATRERERPAPDALVVFD
ncbi:MAG TPA: M23 family metallopeptidase [Steroidobacteraceae bacterium]|nr:M23 family metallopeptidase [Steroidobacteraceae bacterium]